MDTNKSYWKKFSTPINNFASRMRQSFGDYARQRLVQDKQERSARKVHEENALRLDENGFAMEYLRQRKERMRDKIKKQQLSEAKFEQDLESKLPVTDERYYRYQQMRKDQYDKYYRRKSAKMSSLDKVINDHYQQADAFQREYKKAIPQVQKQLRKTARYPYQFGDQFK